jgi:hypothetical protein
MTDTLTKRNDRTPEERLLQQRWHGWGSPVGLSIGLMSVGGFFALFALGLQALAATPY